MKNHLKTAKLLTELLDNKFKVFGFRFGIDPLLGLIPGGGDFISLIASLYILWVGIEMKLPRKKLTQMLTNILLDFCAGLVPILGDILDFTLKANRLNMEIIKKHVEKDPIEGEVVKY